MNAFDRAIRFDNRVAFLNQAEFAAPLHVTWRGKKLLVPGVLSSAAAAGEIGLEQAASGLTTIEATLCALVQDFGGRPERDEALWIDGDRWTIVTAGEDLGLLTLGLRRVAS